ncbi:WxL domain-containing protein [Litchfieldia alkalitelluris]|uniref:WxL domain-containing protein n=1 Tax=Litchfieldia alkalitelluris TaxID=304268 RepID=UPI0009983E8C|nr:WxL domain-containing protein [Litchfieldia alkalitelluris]
MNKFFKKLVVNVAAFGFVIGAFATSSFAANSSITGGSLSMTQPTVDNFAAVTLNGQIQTTTASLGAFTVTDATGTGSGWQLNVKASQFTDSVKGLTLPTNSLDIALPTVTAQAGASDVSTLTKASGKVDNATGVKILSAALNGGMGAYDVSANTLTLNLQPKDVKAGTYTSTVSVTVTTGP